VLNAGIYGPMGPTESVSLDEWRRALDINLFGVLLPSRGGHSAFSKRPVAARLSVLSGGGATNPLPNISGLRGFEGGGRAPDGDFGGRIEKF